MSGSGSPLLEKARRGEPVTALDKIAGLACLQEIAGYRLDAETYGPPLTREEEQALARRKVELTYGRGAR